MPLTVDGQDASPVPPDPRHRTSWNAVDLLATRFPEPRWAIPGLIPEGLTFFAGAPKLGKSWLMLNLCVAVAAGGRALGKIPVEQGLALYLALEDSPRRMKARLVNVLEGERAPGNLRIELEWPSLLDGGADQLGRILTAQPAVRLVVVDVFARVRPQAGSDASKYDADYTAAVPLKALADHHSVAVVAVHHTRKAKSDDFLETVSGTFGLAAAADTVAVLRRARSSADAALSITGRDVDEAEHALRFDAGRWTLLGPASDFELGETRQRILQTLRDRGAMTPKQVADQLDLNHELVKKTLQRMVKDDQCDTDGQGTYLPLSPMSLLSPDGGDRDTGDTRDTPTRGDAL